MLSSRVRSMAAGAVLYMLSKLLCAAPALTTIQDVLYKADGSRFNGVLQITWSSFQAADTTNIATQNITAQVTNGYLRVMLVPTTNAASPAAYTVVYNSDGKVQFTEIWVVPPSTAPLRVADVRSTRVAAGADAVLQMQVADIAGLRTELNIRPTMGSGFAASRAAVIDAGGGIASATGNLSDCVRVDGSSGPCGSAEGSGAPAEMAFSDGETPAGLVDGVNAAFALAAAPSPSSSVTLFRNGLALQNGPDFTISGRTVRFPAGNVPQPGDVLQAFYRTAPGGGGGGGGASGNATQIQGRDVASTAPSDGQLLGWVEANSAWSPVNATARTAVKADGMTVGSEPALNFVPGNGIAQNCVDSAGVQVTCTTSLNTSIALTNAAAQANRPWFCQSTNGSTSYACSLSAAALTTYTAGMCLDLLVDTANTGAATLNVDGVGPKNIKQADGSSEPAAGAIVAGQQVRTCFDGNVWRLPRTHTPTQNGMVAWNGTYVNRSIVGSGGVRCVNGDGTAGNPTCSADTAVMQAQNYAADTGLADAYAVTLPVVPASLTDGLLVAFKAAHSNAGASPTMSINGLPAKAIKKYSGLALAAGDISTNGIYELRYESSCDCFQMQSLPGNAPAGSSLTIQDNSGSTVGTRAILQILNGTYLTCTLIDTGSKLTQQCEPDTTKLVDRTNANIWTAGAKQTLQASGTTAGLNLAPSTLPSGPAAGDVAVDTGGALNVYSGSAWQKAAAATATLTSGAPLVGAGANGITVGTTTGTGDIVRASAPTLSLPVITNFSNAGHNHTNTAGGGTLTPGAITCASGVFKGGTPPSCAALAAGEIPAALSSTTSVNGTSIPASATLMTAATAVAKAQTPLTTKGDLWVTDGTNMHRLGVGTDGQVLTADAASTDGMMWAAGGAGSMAIGGNVTSGSEGSILGVSSGKLAQDSALTWDFANHFQAILRNNIGSTSTEAFVLSNTTAATSGQQQWAPRIHWIGQGWKTNATAASQQTEWTAELRSYSGAAGPVSSLTFIPTIAGTGVNGIAFCGLNAGASGVTYAGTYIAGLDGANGQYNCSTGSGVYGFGPVNGAGVFGAWAGAKPVVNFNTNGMSFLTTSAIMWGTGGNNATTGDVSLDRDTAGVVGVYNGTAPGTTAANYRDMKMRSLVLVPSTAPTCDSTQAGKIQYTAGGTGVADIAQVCSKDATEAYAWRTMTATASGVTSSTLTANVLPKATGASAIGNSSITDDGTTVTSTAAIKAPSTSTGATPPTPPSGGTGGVGAYGEGTAPSSGCTTGVDCIYSDAAAHGLKASFNGDTFSLLARASNNLSFFSATTSAQLAGVLSDETGSGAAVFASSPTLTTPNLGTPSAATLTNAIGLPISTGVSGLGTGVATFLATPSGANLASALTTALPNTKGGTGGDSSASTGFAKVSSGTWSYAAIAAADLPAALANSTSINGVSVTSGKTLMYTDTSVAATQMPALTGECTTSAGAVAVTCGTGIAHTGTDINTSHQVTATHLASPLPAAQGGTANGFFAVSGPASTVKTYTFPNANATMLYSGGALGTPSTATLTNATGLPISTGVSGLGTGVAAFLAAPSGVNLASALTSALPNTKGGTGGDSSAQTGFAKVSSGTWSYAALAGTDLPNPGASTKGGVQSIDCSSGGQFIQKINTDGTETCATPSGSGTVTTTGTMTSGAIVASNGTTVIKTPSATATLDTSGNVSTPGSVTAAGVSTGSTPPTVTVGAGNGGVMALGEGTAPTTYKAAGVDGCYADSTAHGILCSFNNDTASKLIRAADFGTGVATFLATPSGANLASALTTALPNTKGGTGGDSSAQTGYAKVSSGTWSYSAIAAADMPNVTTGSGTGATLTGANNYYFCTGMCSVTPPAPAAGVQFCVANAPGVSTAITLTALGSGKYYGKTDFSAYGTANATMTATAVAGNKICMVGLDANHYVALSYGGTWTAN